MLILKDKVCFFATAGFSIPELLLYCRHKKASWDNYVPDSHKLTDDQITEFVDILKPVIFTGLFSKSGPQDMTTAMFNLAFLRPERLLPQHLEKSVVYSGAKLFSMIDLKQNVVGLSAHYWK